jgi:addiction module HigA family antidote
MARTPIHPGEVLMDELQELRMTASDLARTIRVPVNRVTQIVAGKRGVTADTALRLGQWLGTGPELWMNLQQLYELDRARLDIGEEIARIPRRPAA